jgi:putative inorganic carbon (HCO3(-)) transporter
MRDKWFNFTSRGLEYSLYALAFSVPISISMVEVFFTFAIVFFTAKKIIAKDFKFLYNKTYLYLALFFLFTALSLINSGIYFDRGLKALVAKWLEYVLVFLICADTLKDYKIRRNCAFIFLGISFFVGVDTFFQRFLGWEYFRQREMVKIVGGLAGSTGPFTHYNELGSYLVIMLSLAFAHVMVTKHKIRKFSFGALTVILAAGLLMTFSRGAWLGAGIAFILMMLFLRRFKILLAVVCVLALILMLSPDIRARFLFTFQKGGDSTRFMLWRGAWSMIKENPFLGKGLGTFMVYMPKYTQQETIQYAHNSYLQLWAETGIFGLLSFLLFVGMALSEAFRLLRAHKDALLLGVFCGLCGFLAHSFFDTQLYSLQLSVLFWFMLGLLSAGESGGNKKCGDNII